MLLDVVFLVNKDYQTEHLCLLGGGGVRPNPTNPPHTMDPPMKKERRAK